MPPPVVSNVVRYGDRSEPKCGLDPRLEALPKTGKSPSSSRGVTAEAVTPPPLLDYITDGRRLWFWFKINWLEVSNEHIIVEWLIMELILLIDSNIWN